MCIHIHMYIYNIYIYICVYIYISRKYGRGHARCCAWPKWHANWCTRVRFFLECKHINASKYIHKYVYTYIWIYMIYIHIHTHQSQVRPGPREMLRIADMTCRLPHGRLIVDKLNLVLERGQNVVIQGPSGCGKTSLLRYVRFVNLCINMNLCMCIYYIYIYMYIYIYI